MTVVVKVGGARAVDPEGALADVAALVEGETRSVSEGSSGEHGDPRDEGEDVVVVHGGSTAVDDTLERMGIEPQYVETPSGVVGRFTDAETMEVFEMVFGHLNTQLVAGLQSQGVDAVGLNGVDGKLLAGPRKSAVRVLEDGKRKIKRGDHSGSIKEVNDELLYTLLDDGYTPVAGPPMIGKDSEARSASDSASGDGEEPRAEWIPVNTDADRSAAAIAGALDATLVLLTDVDGVYEDPDDPETLIESVETGEDWETLQDAAEGFMGRKIMAAEEALKGGAPAVVVADANADEPISAALEGSGTHVHETAIDTEDQS